MAAFEFDFDQWPMVLVTIQGKSTKTEVHHFLSWSDNILARQEPYALVVFTRDFLGITVEERRSISQWLSKNLAALEKYCVGQAYVPGNVLERMMLRSVFLLQRPPYPYKVFAELEPALDWVRGQFAAAGRPLD